MTEKLFSEKTSPKMRQVAYLSYMDFQPRGHIPKKAFEKFKKEHKGCIILEEKQGRYIVSLRALKIEDRKLDNQKKKEKKIDG